MAGKPAGGGVLMIRHPACRASSSRGFEAFHCRRGDRNPRQAGKVRLEPALKVGRLRLRHEDAARRDACGAAVQAQPEGERIGDQVQIGAGQDEDRIVAGELERRRRERGARSASTARPVSAEPVRTTRSTPCAMRRARRRRPRRAAARAGRAVQRPRAARSASQAGRCTRAPA